MNTEKIIGIAVCIVVSAACMLFAEDSSRYALVFGNASYDGEAVLINSVNDASDMADALNSIGWRVTKVVDADRKGMNKAISAFQDTLSGTKNPTVLLYYAGHGVQLNGQNYLIPVHETFDDPSDIKNDAISLQSILDGFDEARVSTEVIILDACRDNPFQKKMSRSLGGTRGLSVVAKSTGVEGSAILFATAPGETAADGSGRNGVFTQALLKYIRTDIKLQDLVTKVTADVKSATGGKQVPFNSISLSADLYLAPHDAGAAAPAIAVSAMQGRAKFEATQDGQVYLGQELLGDVGPDIPLETTGLPLGKQSFDFKVEGKVMETIAISLTEHGQPTLTFGKLSTPVAAATAAPKPSATFTLKVLGPEQGMVVLVDGNQIGTTPVEEVLPAQAYSIEVRSPSYATFVTTINPEPNSETLVNPSMTHSKQWQIEDLTAKKTVLASQKKAKVRSGGFWTALNITSWIGTVLGAGLTGYAYYEAQGSLGDYNAQSDPNAIATDRNSISTMNQYFKIGVITGGACLLTAITTGFLTPKTSDLDAQMKSIDRQISKLNGNQ